MLSSPRSRVALAPLSYADDADLLWSEEPTRVLERGRPVLVRHDDEVTVTYSSDDLRAHASRGRLRKAEPHATLRRPIVPPPPDSPPPSGIRVSAAPVFEKRSCTLVAAQEATPAHDTWPAPPPVHVAEPVRMPLLLTPTTAIEVIAPARAQVDSTDAKRGASSATIAALFVIVTASTFLLAHLGMLDEPGALVRDLVVNEFTR